MGTNRVGRKTLEICLIECIETVLEQHVNTDVVTIPQFDIFLNDVLMVFLKTSPAKKRKSHRLVSQRHS